MESVDPFRWLEDPDSPDTIAWVAEQNRRSEAFLSSIPARDVIRARLTALWNYERCGPPERYGDWYIFSKNDGLQPQAVLYKTRTLDGPAEVLLDPLSPGGSGRYRTAAFDHRTDQTVSAPEAQAAPGDILIFSQLDGRTFAQMGDDAKHAISHRGRAMRAIAELLERESVDHPTEH